MEGGPPSEFDMVEVALSKMSKFVFSDPPPI